MAEPKEANAPDPKPNAEALPGGAVEVVLRGGMPLDRLARDDVPSMPEDIRFVGKGRDCASLLRSVLGLWGSCEFSLQIRQASNHIPLTSSPQIVTVHESDRILLISAAFMKAQPEGGRAKA